jgi:pimeloyl-ACP methyl ester carboxylesterase
MTPQRADFASFDGERIAWHELGSGAPIILLHGLFSSGAVNWRRYGAAAEIAGAGFRVIMPDFRAHGESACPKHAGAYPPDVLAMDIEALIAHLGLGDFDIGGYSMGGRAVVRLLARGLRPRRAIIAGMGLAGVTAGADRAAWFIKVAEGGDFAPGSAEAAAAAFMRQNGIDGTAVAHLLRSQVSTPIEVVRSLATPALVVSGAEDRDNGSAGELAMTLANAALVEVPGNHMNAITRPDFGAAIAGWLGHRLGHGLGHGLGNGLGTDAHGVQA